MLNLGKSSTFGRRCSRLSSLQVQLPIIPVVELTAMITSRLPGPETGGPKAYLTSVSFRVPASRVASLHHLHALTHLSVSIEEIRGSPDCVFEF